MRIIWWSYYWGRDPRVPRWLMRPICARTSLGQWEQGMVAAEADVAVPFLSLLRCSTAAFLLASQTFAQRLTILRYLSLFCARYSKQLGSIPKDFTETFSVSLKRFFWSSWYHFPRDSSQPSSFFGSWWFFMQITSPVKRTCDCIKMI